MAELVELFKTFGPTAAISIVFVWQAVLREKRMTLRIDNVEDYIRTELNDTVRENTQAMNLLTAAVNSK